MINKLFMTLNFDWVCNECGHIFKPKRDSLLTDYKCPKCKSSNTKSNYQRPEHTKPTPKKPLPPKETIETGRCPHCDTMLIKINREYFYAKDFAEKKKEEGISIVGIYPNANPYLIVSDETIERDITRLSNGFQITHICNNCKSIIGFSESTDIDYGFIITEKRSKARRRDDDMMMFMQK